MSYAVVTTARFGYNVGGPKSTEVECQRVKSVKHTLDLVKRMTELEAAMRQPTGIRLAEYQELQRLREQLSSHRAARKVAARTGQ